MGISLSAPQLSRSKKQLDLHIERLTLPNCQRIYCQKGCPNCCSLVVNCSFPEAAAIASLLSTGQRESISALATRIQDLAKSCPSLKDFLRLYRDTVGSCIFLDSQSQACSIYSERPLSCRALLSSRPSAWCGVDFSSLHPLEKTAFLSSLDRNIVNFPTHYLAAPQELASELETDLIWSMQQQCGYGLSGNLIYQVWLEMEHTLSNKLKTGDFDLIDYLNQHQIFHPLLLQIRTAK